MSYSTFTMMTDIWSNENHLTRLGKYLVGMNPLSSLPTLSCGAIQNMCIKGSTNIYERAMNYQMELGNSGEEVALSLGRRV